MAVAVITGASAGVGRAAARAFAAHGFDLGLLARGRAGLEVAAEEVRRAGRSALPLPTDVADPRAVEEAASSVEEALGPIDVWVNVAFASVMAPFAEVSPEEFKRATEVTYIGFVNGTRAALARMVPRDRGTVIQAGSALAFRGIPLQAVYCGAKHAIHGFTESVRCELLHQGSEVRITEVHLPALNTPQFGWILSRVPRRTQPVPPIYQPELAGRALLHAALHPRRRAWWLGGPTAMTIIGNSLAPGLLDRYLGRTGYQSQQTDEPADPQAPANLWEPADDETDAGAHGDFGDRSRSRSAQWLYTRHRVPVLAGMALGAAAAVSARRPSPADQVDSEDDG